MTYTTFRFLVLMFAVLAVQPARSQQIRIQNQEPAVFHLEDLLRTSDIVVLVKILSGDTENYPITIYKAEVLKSFKGASGGEIIYFGPYNGMQLGFEYVLFLRRAAKPLAPNPGSASNNYGTISYLEVFDEGYSAMETSYECVFEGKEPAQSCDYGVRVCTDYIRLPKSVPTFPPMTEQAPFGCRWIRKHIFLSLLDTLPEPGH